MKKIIKIFVVFWLFFLFISGVNASFEAKLQTDKTQIWVWDVFNLNFEVKTDTWWNIEIQWIKNLDKFQVLWQSQSSSTATKIVMVNWQTKSKTITTYNLVLQLRALQKWEYEIWPAIIKQGNNKIETNSVLLKIWDGMSLMWNKSVKNNNLSTEKQTNNFEITKKYFDNKNVYLLLLLVFSWIIFYIYKNREFLIKDNKVEDFNESVLLTNEDEEIEIENNLKEITYPDINDENFVNKIDDIFRKKVENKYHLKNIDTLTYEEILEKTNDETINQIIDLLRKIKYWNLILDKTKVLELVKKI